MDEFVLHHYWQSPFAQKIRLVFGLIKNSNLDIIDNNINNITWWTDKHNRFAIREMIEFFLQKERVKEKGAVR